MPARDGRAASPSQALRDVKERLDRFMGHHSEDMSASRPSSRGRRYDSLASSPKSETLRSCGGRAQTNGRGWGSSGQADFVEDVPRQGPGSERQGDYVSDRYERELQRIKLRGMGESWDGGNSGRDGGGIRRSSSMKSESAGGRRSIAANTDIEDIDSRLKSLQEFLRAAKKGPERL